MAVLRLAAVLFLGLIAVVFLGLIAVVFLGLIAVLFLGLIAVVLSGFWWLQYFWVLVAVLFLGLAAVVFLALATVSCGALCRCLGSMPVQTDESNGRRGNAVDRQWFFFRRPALWYCTPMASRLRQAWSSFCFLASRNCVIFFIKKRDTRKNTCCCL